MGGQMEETDATHRILARSGELDQPVTSSWTRCGISIVQRGRFSDEIAVVMSAEAVDDTHVEHGAAPFATLASDAASVCAVPDDRGRTPGV